MSEDPNSRPEPAVPSTPTPAPPEARPHEMRLHPGRPPVTRLSRKVLLGLSVAGTLVILAALGVALWPHAQAPQSESVNTGNRNTPEGLAGLPKDYAELAKAAPKIGPPLPGDLGKPMLNAGVTPPPMRSAQPTAEQQRILQEQDAARTSHLCAINNTATQPQPLAPTPPSATTPQVNQTSSAEVAQVW